MLAPHPTSTPCQLSTPAYSMSGSCGHGNEPLGFIKGGEFLD